jgi:hypothetical protein
MQFWRFRMGQSVSLVAQVSSVVSLIGIWGWYCAFMRWQVELFVGCGGVPTDMALSVIQSDSGTMFLAIASPPSSAFNDDEFSTEHFLSIGVPSAN